MEQEKDSARKLLAAAKAAEAEVKDGELKASATRSA